MQVYRIHITSWTSSFRYPNLISGFQPTLLVPPLSTLMGLIASAKGGYYMPREEKLGFIFLAGTKATDLETIYQMGNTSNSFKSNIIKREFLFDNHLFLYTDSKVLADYFTRPYYPLLLGRSNDLASVVAIEQITVTEKDELTGLKGTVIPFLKYKLPAVIQALPQGFTNTIPRRNIGTRPYCLLDAAYKQQTPVKAAGFADTVPVNGRSMEWDVYWQELK